MTIRSISHTLHQKMVKVIFFIYGLNRYVDLAFSFGTHFYIASVLSCTDLSWLGNFWPLGGHKHSERGSQQSSPPLEIFQIFFSTCFWYELEIWYTHLVGDTTHQVSISIWKLVYTLSRLQNILSSLFTRMGPMRPTPCSWPIHI